MPGGPAWRRTLVGAAVVVCAAVGVAACSSGAPADSAAGAPAGSAAKTTSAALTPGGATGGAAPGSAAGSAPSVAAPPGADGAGNTEGKQIQGAIDAVVADSPIAFDVDSAELSTLDEVTLKAVAAVLEGNDRAVVVKTFAHAHTGDPAAARSLAHQRGEAVVDQLEGDGVDKSRLTFEASINPPDGVDPDRALVTVGSR